MNSRPIHQMTVEPSGTLNALEYLLLGDLRELLEEPETEQTRHALPVLVNGLLDNRLHHSQLNRQRGIACPACSKSGQIGKATLICCDVKKLPVIPPWRRCAARFCADCLPRRLRITCVTTCNT